MSFKTKNRKGKTAKLNKKTRLYKRKSKNNAHHLTKNRLILPLVLLVIILAVLFFLRPAFIGYFAVEEAEEHIKEVDKLFVENSTHTFIPEIGGEIRSLKLNGQLIGDGSARVYLETDNESYLIFDSNALEEKGLADITGLVVGELNETIPPLTNETAPVNESLNETEQLNETIDEITNPPEDAEILIKLEYNDGTEFDIDNNGIEAKGGIVDFNVNAEFNWDVDEANLCTRWETYSLDNETSVIICYGNEICCNFIGLEPLTSNWNEVFYSYYSRYGATANNKISSQVVYVDYNTSEENPYSYVYYSDWASLNAVFLEEEEKITKFDDICMETCLLSLNQTAYRLRIELENTTLRLDNISYTIIPEEAEIINNAPVLLSNISDILISMDGNVSIDLNEYFYDQNNDLLEYVVYEMEDISILIDGSIVTLTPSEGFTGVRNSFFIANDSNLIAVSNVFKVSVVEAEEIPELKEVIVKNITDITETPTQLAAEINKPVKWVRKVNAENNETIAKSINVSFSIPGEAFNINVKDIKLNKTIEKNKIILKNKTKIKAEEKDKLKAKEEEFEFPDLIESNETKEYIIEYETEAPVVIETDISTYKKQIIVSSDIHYVNVLAYTDVPVECAPENIKLYWIKNGVRELFTSVGYYDLNNNSLIDRIEWIVPSLSNQTFEVEINVLNVQSYPTVGGEWTVRFNTIGTANLTIRAVDGTTYGDSAPDDLKFLELKCGDDVVNASFDGSKVFVPDYECNETAYHTVRVLTEGVHTQLFSFGDAYAYAKNLAGQVPKTLNIQGKLTDSSGTALTGKYNFSFKIYNVSTSGTKLWEENQTLAVQDGVYDAILGSSVALTLDFDRQYYLGVQVGTDDEMSPRLNLTSTPYTYRASYAENISLYSTGGLIMDSTGLSLNRSCSDGQILKWNSTKSEWFCTADAGGVASEADTLQTVTDRGNTTTQPLTIDSDGDETTIIGGDLEVQGNITGGSPVKIKGGLNVLNESGDTQLYVNATSGNVGIGTTSPGQLLHVYGEDAIDVGELAIDRSTTDTGYTNVNRGNPANADGKITSVEIWANTNLTNCEVGIFYEESPWVLTTRDTETIGSVTAGSKQTFSVDLDVKEGDYIGIYFTAGDIEYDSEGYGGIMALEGDYIPCSNETFDAYSGDTVSLYGTGDVSFVVTSAGYVGIGTTKPQRKLSVYGDAVINDQLFTTLDNGIFLGRTRISENQWVLGDVGATWSQKTSDATRNWIPVAMSSDGKYQTAAVYDGYIYGSSDYGATWSQKTSTTRNWRSAAMSSDGKYQTAVVYDGYIYGSSDYGTTWSQKTSDATRNWRSAAMSSDGKYQTAVVYDGYIYGSSDYGTTWSQKTSDATRYWVPVAMSSDGKYQTAADYGYIYCSSDYGATWSQKTGAVGREWGSVAMSSDGKYQTAVVSYGGYIYGSSDYGATWSQKTSDATRNWVPVAMSSDGKYQTAAVYGGYIYGSSDYGATWSQKTSDATRSWQYVAMSSDGKYQTATDYGGYIYGSTANSYIATGNVGIGTVSPEQLLHVYGKADIIDIGEEAIVRDGTCDPLYTSINLNNPANETGTITSVEIYASVNLVDCKVATFFLVADDNYSTRDWEAIGDVTAGSKQTFEVSLDVEAGDFIGIYYTSGNVYAETGTGEVLMEKNADLIPCTDADFDAHWGFYRHMSLYGTGIVKTPFVVTSAGKVGIGTTSPGAQLQVNDKVAFSTDTTPFAGAGTKLLWIPAKAAFRAGNVTGTQWDDANIGSYSFSSGYNSKANNTYSTAMGRETTASGTYSTAMGWGTTASNEASTAMGEDTTASGYISTAMGGYTDATGAYSTAMGGTTTASGFVSTAMGDSTTASGYISTAMGGFTNASGKYSTAMGYYTDATGNYSTAMGYKTNATGDYSFASGYECKANNTYATAMGYKSDATGVGSTAIGYSTTSSGIHSIAIGDGATANYDYAVALGSYTTASGGASTAIGQGAEAGGYASVAMGDYTTASGYASVAMGDSTEASNYWSTAMGYSTTASGFGSTAMGREINASGDYSFGISLNDPASDYLITDNSVMAIMGGNVGIGTTSPSQKLEVNGSINISGSGEALYFPDGTNMTTSSGGASAAGSEGAIQFYSGGDLGGNASQFFINSTTSNVGIGTTTPGSKLSVNGVTTLHDRLEIHTDIEWYSSSKYGGAGNSDDGSLPAGASIGWTNPTNADDNESTYALASSVSDGNSTYYLNVDDLGFSIPAGAQIRGVEVLVGRTAYECCWYAYDNSIRLIKGGTIQGDDKNNTAPNSWGDYGSQDCAPELAYTTYGGPTDLWGLSLSVSDVNSSNFGFAFSGKADGGNVSGMKIRIAKVTVHYTYEGSEGFVLGIDNNDSNKFKLSYGDTLGTNDAFTIDTSGNISIGTISAKLNVKVSSGPAAIIGSIGNEATGSYAIAMGDNTNASGSASTAMGVGTTASGYYSTAMGWGTTASGSASTAMGDDTTASGYYSTAMGQSTTASGNFGAIAMGYNTNASGDYGAIAMGDDTTASGQSSTAMGEGTTASRAWSTAMGWGTTASGYTSTAMGQSTTASGDESTAMGYYTTASGDYSTAMGSYTTASGDTSTAMGYDTTASGSYSLTIGEDIEAGGSHTVAIALSDQNGLNVSQANTMAIMGGNVGIGTVSPGANLQVDGTVAFSTGTTPFAGIGTKLLWIPAKSAFRAGYVNSNQWDDANIGSYSFASGYNTKANNTYATAIGASTTASGLYSTAIGSGSTASGQASTAMGYYPVASGYGSTAMGYYTIASGLYSTAMGYDTIAGGDYSTAIGNDIEAGGDYSVAIALSDQDGLNVSQANTMAIMGGNVGIGTVSPEQLLHVYGKAGIIDIGNEAIAREDYVDHSWTTIDLNNPANESGIITSIEIWAETDLVNCEVATFFLVSGDSYSTRDTESIGSVASGSKQTFSVNLDVVVGDYIGIFFTAGKIEGDAVSGTILKEKEGDYIPCTGETFANHWVSRKRMSLYGTGIVKIPFVVTSAGKVGIGTTSPKSKLAVSGLPSGATATGSGVDGSLVGAVCITDTGNIYIDTDGTCAG